MLPTWQIAHRRTNGNARLPDSTDSSYRYQRRHSKERLDFRDCPCSTDQRRELPWQVCRAASGSYECGIGRLARSRTVESRSLGRRELQRRSKPLKRVAIWYLAATVLKGCDSLQADPRAVG